MHLNPTGAIHELPSSSVSKHPAVPAKAVARVSALLLAQQQRHLTANYRNHMPRGGGGGGRSGGGGYRGSGRYRGRSTNSKTTGSDQKSEGDRGRFSEFPGGTHAGSTGYTGGGSGGTGSAGYSTFTRAAPASTPTQLQFAPSTKECQIKFQDLRSCLEANGDRLSSCSWYFMEWKKCQQQHGASSGYSDKSKASK